VLIVLSGLPGTGKSAIAEGLANALAIPVLSVDPIESAIIRAGLPRGFETGYAAYLVAEAVADATLKLGLGCVIDAANYVEPGRDLWRGLAVRSGSPMKVIVCTPPHEDTHRARLSARDRDLARGEPTWDDVERQRAEWTPWPERHLVLDSTRPIKTNLAEALRYVRSPSN
jgi:predicted kinase